MYVVCVCVCEAVWLGMLSLNSHMILEGGGVIIASEIIMNEPI